MKRRTFLRVVGGSTFCSLVAPEYLLAEWKSGRLDAYDVSGVLIEACRFEQTGGWSLDTQHYQQMGGNYLLAHGMGTPVSPATTTLSLPESGSWYVSVRTRDWCPGNWKSPGRFQLVIDGQVLEQEFGSEGRDGQRWHWHTTGPIEIQDASSVRLELRDLTGFDGRCDAIYFSRQPPASLPVDTLDVVAWKDRMAGREGQPIEDLEFDLVVVGGGIAGCAAALAARSRGLKVALIQDRPVFGGNASQEVRVHTIGIHGLGKELLQTIDTPHYPNGHSDARKAQEKREASLLASGVSLFPGHICMGLSREGNRIQDVEARDVVTGKIKRFSAPTFADCTGDAWLGVWAGAEYREGRESHREFDEAWDKHGDLWSPEKPDQRVMGASVLWNSERVSQAAPFPEVPWALPVAKGHKATEGEWYWEYSDNDLDQIADAEQIRDHVLRAIYGSFSNAKKDPRNAPVKLTWVAHVAGKRESRRLMGDYIYTMQDMVQRREFEDAVVEEVREIDAHYQLKETGSPQDFLSKALFRKTGGKYFIPFRCLYARDVSNLMMAGRCFSCSHIGLCGPRVMLTCGQMGIAVGFAAALCRQYETTPREVGQRYISELRQWIGYQ